MHMLFSICWELFTPQAFFLYHLQQGCLKTISAHYCYIQTTILCAPWNQRAPRTGYYWGQSESVHVLLLCTNPVATSLNSWACLQLVLEGATLAFHWVKNASICFPIRFLLCIVPGSQGSSVTEYSAAFTMPPNSCSQFRHWIDTEGLIPIKSKSYWERSD